VKTLTPSSTENDSSAKAAAPTPELVDPLGRASPHGCVLGFLRAAGAKDYDKAAQYLDGKRTPKQSEELASKLKYLLDQGMSTSIDDLSRSPNGNIEDQLRLSREYIGTVKTPKGDLKLMLDLVKRPEQPSVWLFSQETLNLVPGAYASMQHTDYGHFFPAWASSISFKSVPLWRWVVILLSLIVGFGIASVLTRAVLWLLRRAFSRRLSAEVEASVLALKMPILCLMLAFIAYVDSEHAITALGRHYWETAGFVLACFGAAWLSTRVADTVINFARLRFRQRMQVERATFVSLLGRLFKIFVGLVLIIALLTRAGVNVSALVAGLGIGGIALALAAQKTLADLFGGFSIVMRGTIRVGDTCQIDGITGTIEDIGISALNLRTLDRSLVSIPNAKVAEEKLENFSLRDQFWVHQLLILRIDTPANVVRTVSDGIFQLLESDPVIEKNTARSRVINLTSTGPQIEVFAYFRTPGADWGLFLAYQESLILKILAVIEAAGTSLASPIGLLSTDTYTDTDSSPSKKR